jgi:hypothetical protein
MPALLTQIQPLSGTQTSVELFQPTANGDMYLGMTQAEAELGGFLLVAGMSMHMTLKPYESLFCYSLPGYLPNYLLHVNEVSRHS